MFFRRSMALLGHVAFAMQSLIPMGLDFRARESIQEPPQYKGPFKKASRGRSKSIGAFERLALDRSSSVRKMQRWLNNGTLTQRVLTERAIMRHKVRRVERQRAANLAKLAAG